MKQYELTVVMPGKTTEAKKKTFDEKLAKMVQALDGKVVKGEDWGEVDLAYRINKQDSAVFLYFELEMPAKSAPQLRDKFQLEDEVIRHLLVVKE